MSDTTTLPVTPRELWDISYDQMSISPKSFIDDDTDRERFELQQYNISAVTVFNAIKNKTSRTDNILTETADLLSIDDMNLDDANQNLIEAGFTAFRLSSTEQILRVFAKFNEDSQNYTLLRYISPLNMSRPVAEALKDNYGPERYTYTSQENKLYVFPAPEKTVRNGLMIKVRRDFVSVSRLEDASTQVPFEYAHLLKSLLCSTIAKRNKEFAVAAFYENMYKEQIRDAVGDLAERSAEKQYTYVGPRQQYR